MTSKLLSNIESSIEYVENLICELQKSKIILQEQIKTEQRNFNYSLNEVALKVIDALDLINLFGSNENLDLSVNAPTVIKKLEKRLVDILLHLEVEEIELTRELLEPDKIRVIETQERSDATKDGSIIKVCRKGYRRAGKVIRAMDVITARNKIKS